MDLLRSRKGSGVRSARRPTTGTAATSASATTSTANHATTGSCRRRWGSWVVWYLVAVLFIRIATTSLTTMQLLQTTISTILFEQQYANKAIVASSTSTPVYTWDVWQYPDNIDGKPSTIRSPQELFDEHEAVMGGWTLFYNIYIPSNNPKDQRSALNIVQEQVQQLQHSYAATHYPALDSNVTLFYNVIHAKDDAWNHTWMQQDVCSDTHTVPSIKNKEHRRSVRCVHMDDYAQGFETVTLHRLYQFCHKHPAQKVIYFHSKGSHHDQSYNQHWRPRLAEAAFGADCLTSTTKTTTGHDNNASHHQHQCSICGLHFLPVWAPILAGNFWVAECAYVRTLVPPTVFGSTMNELISQHVLSGTMRNRKLTATLFRARDMFCDGRYADECWIGSHPQLQPCDLSPVPHALAYQKPPPEQPQNLSFHAGTPRFHVFDEGWFGLQQQQLSRIQQHPNERTREFFYLAGHLLKWNRLYPGIMPHNNSWVWSWFPEGQEWQQAWWQHGAERALDHMLARTGGGTTTRLLSYIMNLLIWQNK